MYSVLEHKHSATLISCIFSTTLFISGTRHKRNIAVFAKGLWSILIPVKLIKAPKYFCTRCDCPHKKQEFANPKQKQSGPVLAVALEYVLNLSVLNQSAKDLFYL